MSLGIFGYDDECIKIYDPEKKELIGVYDNYPKAEKATGISVKSLHNAVKYKTRRFSPFLNKEIAVRVSSKIKKP